MKVGSTVGASVGLLVVLKVVGTPVGIKSASKFDVRSGFEVKGVVTLALTLSDDTNVLQNTQTSNFVLKSDIF